MKTRIMVLISVAALLAVPLFADYHEQMGEEKGQQMDQQKAQTVEEITAAEEGTEVKLEGNIIEEHEENFYLFKDDTGELKLKISDDVWGDREVNPDQELEVKGSVAMQPDTDELYIDVSEIEESGEMPEHAKQKREEAQQKRQEAEQRRQEREQQQEEDSGWF